MVWGFFGGKKKQDSSSENVMLETEAVAAPAPEFVSRPSSELMPDLQPLESMSRSPIMPRYNPYEGLPSTLDPGMLEKLYSLPEDPEFLFSEEKNVHRRGWSENLTYCTGAGYFGGAVLGGAYGALSGYRTPATLAVDSSKLMANRVLNAATNRGTLYGNTLGCIGLFYSGLESLIAGQRGRDDVLNSVLAGTGAGVLYKATGGPRGMLVYGSALGTVFGAAATANALFKGKPLLDI